jgi:hypothetical protein
MEKWEEVILLPQSKVGSSFGTSRSTRGDEGGLDCITNVVKREMREKKLQL